MAKASQLSFAKLGKINAQEISNDKFAYYVHFLLYISALNTICDIGSGMTLMK